MIGGVNVLMVSGIINLVLILFQVASGIHLLKVKPKTHRSAGILLLTTSIIHASMAILM